MEVLIAQHAGFCEGVERAYRIALETAKAGKPVYMLGNLVHNRQVVDKFKQLGTITVKTLAEIPVGGGVLLISAHGVVPEVYEEAKGLGLGIIDTTCSWVKRAQKIAGEYAKEGRQVVIVGDKNHPEVTGLLGWSGPRAIVIENESELKSLRFAPTERIGILAQTTQAAERFQAVVDFIKKQVRDVKAFNTICGATCKRQAAAVELAGQVDLMLVIGDKLSANTKRLVELCTATGTQTHQIQTAAELDQTWLKNKHKVGVTAGASTPEWVIQEVIKCLS